MAEKNKKVSLTFRVDKGVLSHNNRNFIAKNVDRERVSENITYKQENLREKYNEIFGKALEEYNAKIRADRRIPDYYTHIENSKQEKLFYEVVVQIGDKDNCGIGAENFESAKQMLESKGNSINRYRMTEERRRGKYRAFTPIILRKEI